MRPIFRPSAASDWACTHAPRSQISKLSTPTWAPNLGPAWRQPLCRYRAGAEEGRLVDRTNRVCQFPGEMRVLSQ